MRYLNRFPYFFHLFLLILISDDYIPDNSIKKGKFQQQDKRELTSWNLYGGGLHSEIEGEMVMMILVAMNIFRTTIMR